MPVVRTLHGATLRPASAILVGALTLVPLLASCNDAERTAGPRPPSTPLFTPGSGTTRTYIGQGTYRNLDDVKRGTDDWEVEVKAKGGLEVLVQSFAYDVDAQTGWHRHPGPVFIQVLEGTVTFFHADDPTCSPRVVHAGQGYLDLGEHAHIGRNLNGAPAKDLVVYLARQAPRP